ncbi:MAG TPA: glycine cleavage system protein GcvH [Candidatus Nanopelagicaceae bacterium]
MSSVPDNLSYTKEHEWVREISADLFRIGITDFAQGALGDIVYVQLPKVGDSVRASSVCGEVESTKSVSEIYSPITGTIKSINVELDKAPELINQDPYGTGWIAEIEISGAPTGLLSASEYETLTA